MPKNILVTGGAGYIGSHICKSLSLADYRPITLDNLSNGNQWAVRWGPLEKADIADSLKVARLIRQYDIDSAIHCAAYAYVGESMRHPGKYFENNVSKSLKMLDTFIDNGIRHLVFSSSCAVYGIPKTLPITEKSTMRPVNPYGESKLFIERALEWYCRAHGLRSISLRYFNAAGADLDAEIGEWHDPETHIIPLAISAALGERENFEIFGTDYATRDGTPIRDYIHVADLAEAHVLALEKLQGGSENLCLNLGTGAGYSVLDIIKAIEEVCRSSVPIQMSSPRSGDPAVLIALSEQANRSLDWQPKHSDLETIIQSAWNWQVKCTDEYNFRYSRK
jgi:UDP-arabinose 4-epimerase